MAAAFGKPVVELSNEQIETEIKVHKQSIRKGDVGTGNIPEPRIKFTSGRDDSSGTQYERAVVRISLYGVGILLQRRRLVIHEPGPVNRIVEVELE